jgi:hypothetical protein
MAALDEFRMAHVGWYHTPQGNITVATPFHMSTYVDAEQKKYLTERGHIAELQRVAASVHIDPPALVRVQSGRGTPEEIHRLTQAVIDAQPKGTPMTWMAIRQLMWNRCIGIDCAGYTQQAYLRATGRSATEAGFHSLVNENLSGLERRGFAPVPSLSEVRSGDILVLGPPEKGEPGHRVLVYDQRLATTDDLRTLLGTRAGQSFALGGPVRVLELDSSYGAGGEPERGGVQRQTWLHNEATGQWAREVLDGENGSRLVVRPSLCDHPLEGFYRRRGD